MNKPEVVTPDVGKTAVVDGTRYWFGDLDIVVSAAVEPGTAFLLTWPSPEEAVLGERFTWFTPMGMFSLPIPHAFKLVNITV